MERSKGRIPGLYEVDDFREAVLELYRLGVRPDRKTKAQIEWDEAENSGFDVSDAEEWEDGYDGWTQA